MQHSTKKPQLCFSLAGPVKGVVWDDFDTMRARVSREWDTLPAIHDPRSPSLKAKIDAWIANFAKENAK
jgi:hypothetical protein